MYPPTNGKVEIWGLRSMWHFGSGWCTPPGLEKLKQVQVTSDVPPTPGMEKLKSQVSGQCDILVLADVTPPPHSNGKVEISGLRSMWHFGSGWCNPSPPPTVMEKLKSHVNVTFWFWLMYPPQEWKSWNLRSMWHFSSGWCTPPRMEKLKSQVNVTFWFWLMYPPQEWKSWNLRSMWHFWFWLMYTPLGMEKLKSQVNVTFWLWLMYPPPPGMEKLKSQVNVTFWFWLMYHPPSQKLKFD